MKKIIHAISFFYKGERIVVKVNKLGKFKIPVTEVQRGNLKTRLRLLTAKETIEHDIIKKCDPTLYLANDEKIRVYPGGDPSYLPAFVDGIATKHDESNKPELPKLKKTLNSGYKDLSQRTRDEYRQAGTDMYGWWPPHDGHAD